MMAPFSQQKSEKACARADVQNVQLPPPRKIPVQLGKPLFMLLAGKFPLPEPGKVLRPPGPVICHIIFDCVHSSLVSFFRTFQKKKKPAAALPCAYSRLLPVSFLLQLSCIGCRLCGSGWQKEGSGRSSGRQCCCAQTLFWLLPTINIKIIPCHTNLGSPPGGYDN